MAFEMNIIHKIRSPRSQLVLLRAPFSVSPSVYIRVQVKVMRLHNPQSHVQNK